MNRKDLQSNFNIIGENKDITLFWKDKEKHGCTGIGYCGNMSLVRGKAVFNGKAYNDVDELAAAVSEWGKNLEWPVDTYCPMTRHICNVQNRVEWFITKKMGFSFSVDGWSYSYKKDIGDYSISFKIDTKGDKITVSTRLGMFHFMQDFDNENDAIAMISNITRGCVLSMSYGIVDALSVLPDTDVVEIQTFVKDKSSLLGIKKADYRTTMIELLERELKKLKGE